MCTLILIDRVVPGCPVLVAANRDEFYARPAAPPARFDAAASDGPWVVAPQDLEAGGTWMGLNGNGLFVGLTNRPSDQLDRGRRSRGLLVWDALNRPSAAAVAGEMAGSEGTYNPFHLVYADGRESFISVQDEGALATRRLEPGIHVVCNRDHDDPGSSKVTELSAAVAAIPLDRPFEAIFDELVTVLGSHPHAETPHENACVHTPDYGTRSSAIVASGESRAGFWYAAGPPCETKFRNVSRLLDERGPARTDGGRL